MKFSKILQLFLCAVLLMQSGFVFAFETDQYNLPTVPLADIGDEVSDYAEQSIRKAFEKTNAEIAEHAACLEKETRKNNCGSADEEKARLAVLRSDDKIIREIFKILGGGVPPFTNAGTFMEKHEFKAKPARYKTSFSDSIFTRFAVNYLTISDTVRIYGAEFGTDKVAHFYQQGYSYYKIRERAIARNVSPGEAVKKAVRFGKRTERTIYGTLISGVYSNADLCANYAGMRFYENLTKEIKIGNETHPPILVLKNGFWAFNEMLNLHENLIKPFLDETLNEALNPSVYIPLFGFRASARRTVREKACPQWREKFSNLNADDYRKQTDSLKLWHGEDYGYTASRNFITIADTCFGGEADPKINNDEK